LPFERISGNIAYLLLRCFKEYSKLCIKMQELNYIKCRCRIKSFQDYLFICCRHSFLDYLRQKKSAARFQSATTSDGKNAVALVSFSRWLNSEAVISISEEELERAIEACISSFSSEKVRNILSDYVHGYSLNEIAGRRDCPLGTAGSIWHRNKDRLLQCILKKIGRL